MPQQKFILSPSLLSSDFGNLRQELQALENADIEWVHWDVMDGHFVPNITLGPPLIEQCRKSSNLFFDVHLMIDNPHVYIQHFARAGADLICIHAEVAPHLESALSQIEKLGVKPAVALNPHTPLCQIEYVLPQVYMVLLMSVNPGFGGQKFIPFTLKKIARLKQMIDELKTQTLIQVDGGVNLENAAQIVKHGANVLVSGSAFFAYPPYKKRHDAFQKAVLDQG